MDKEQQAVTPTAETETGGNVKMFSQAELDGIIEARLQRERQKMPSEKDMAEFNDWKTKQSKPSEELLTAQAEVKRVKVELELYKAKAKPEFVKFLTSELSDGQNLENYKKENPQYFVEENQKKISSSPRLNGGVALTETSNQRMNRLLRGG